MAMYRERGSRVATWQNMGKDVSDCRTTQEVLVKAGLDYTVIKKPAYDWFGGRYRKSDEYFWTRRKSDGFRYGLVGKGYEVVQNNKAFGFVDYIPDITFVKAGETSKGRVYIIAKLPDVNILGDAFTPYIVFENGFGGNSSIKIILSPLRCICANQIPIISKEAENANMFRHTQGVTNRVKIAGATHAKIAAEMARLNTMAQGYAAMKVTPRQVRMILDAMFPVAVDTPEATIRRIEEQKQMFVDEYNEADNYAFRGTAWGLINAYTSCLTRKPLNGRATEESRFVNLTLDRRPKVFNVSPGVFLDMVKDIAVA